MPDTGSVKDKSEKKEEKAALPERTFLSPSRLTTLSDGVFAIVMTLLVLDMKVNEGFGDGQLITQLLKLLPQLESYFYAFVAVGIFWFVHHYQFNHIIKVDRKMIWINIILLMVITLIPFTMDLLEYYYVHSIAGIIFSLNMLLALMVLFLNWKYACSRPEFMAPDVDDAVIKSVSTRLLISCGIFLLTVIVQVNVKTAFLLYLIVPIILYRIDGKKSS